MPARLLISKQLPVSTLLLVLMLISISPTSSAQPPAACTCLWQGPFSQASQYADLIVSGRVISSKGNSLDFKTQKTLADRIAPNEFRQTIRIWGDNGQYCRPEISNFPKDSEWLFALKKISSLPANSFNPNTPNISFGRINDYYISSCGVNWLNIQEGYVSGPLVKSQRWNWQDDTMNPVLLPLVDAYINDVIPEQALVEAAKPQTEAKKLLEETKQFIFNQ